MATFLLSVLIFGSADYIGHFCVPCGYLDFNETLEDAVKITAYSEHADLIITDQHEKISSNMGVST